MSRVSTLLRLQVIDLEIEEKSKRVREIDERLASDPATAAARATLEAERTKLAALRGELHATELEAKSLDARVVELEQRLYGGRIQNPTELDGIQKQVQMLKRQRSGLDDRLLELMESVDQSQSRYDASAKALSQAEANRAGQVEQLARERDLLAARLADLSANREHLRGGLDADALRIYDHLRHKAGRAVAPLRQNACSICGVAVPTGVVQRIHMGSEFVPCSGCGRILAG